MMPKAKEAVKWNVRWTIEKYRGNLPTEEDRKLFKPYEVLKGEGNLLLDAGVDKLLDLLTGAGGTAYNNANARLGVGSSNAAAVKTQTALQSVILMQDMDGSYPTSTGQLATFRATFGSSEGNGAWEEWGIDNGSGEAVMLNRKVVTLGTKVSGTTWVFTVTVALS